VIGCTGAARTHNTHPALPSSAVLQVNQKAAAAVAAAEERTAEATKELKKVTILWVTIYACLALHP
jgi:hypothetical protein